MENASPFNNFHYNKNLQALARNLRNEMTKAESCLWKYVLRGRKMHGFQFRRQRPVLNYVADFMCKELLLIIEVDGITHSFDHIEQKDLLKQEHLEEVGFTVLRFKDNEILHRIDDVFAQIENFVLQTKEEI